MAEAKKLSVVLLIALGFVVGGLWYWNTRPANVQAAIADARTAANRNDVMSVEAISEGGASVVGRQVSIHKARVSQVTGPRTFWIAGDEGEPLLVLIALSGDGAGTEASLKLEPGTRVSVSGVLRSAVGREPLGSEDRAQVAKASVHLVASEVNRVR
jgi:hypothetical protein